MSSPLVAIDADVLGRQRTGDETYVANLLRELAGLEHDLRLAAVARRADVVPDGIEPLVLPAESQSARMAWSLPRLLRRVGAKLGHFQYVVPPLFRARSVVTIHDLSFERDPRLMGMRDRLLFRTFVPRSARRADRVFTVSEWTKRDVLDTYRVGDEKLVVTPNGVDPAFNRDEPQPLGNGYLLFVGALHPRKDPLTALEALALLGGDLRLVLVGPDKGLEGEVRRAATRLGIDRRIDFRGHVEKDELARLYRGASCLVFPSRYEGFGLPALEAMACGTPVVATTAGALPEATGGAAVLVEPGSPVALAAGVERALAEREGLVRAGLEQAGRYSWAETARRTLAVYEEVL